MKARYLLIGCSILSFSLIGCAENRTLSSVETVSSPSHATTTEVAVATPVAQNQVISAKGIGTARLGMTFGELKEALGTNAEFMVESPYMVDFDAIAVRQNDAVQYYILYPAGTTFTDDQVIEILVTDNPNYRTEQGVGAGTLLKEAEAIYGEATLSYNSDNESREYVNFSNHPSEFIAFRSAAPEEGQFAGIYPESSASSEYQTTDYAPNASIARVEVR